MNWFGSGWIWSSETNRPAHQRQMRFWPLLSIQGEHLVLAVLGNPPSVLIPTPSMCVPLTYSELEWVAQLCLTPCDPIDCSLPGSSGDGIFQAKVLGWVAISFSRGSDALPSEPPGKPTLSSTPDLFERPCPVYKWTGNKMTLTQKQHLSKGNENIRSQSDVRCGGGGG